MSLRRVWHEAHFARAWWQQAEEATPPDIVLTPIPTLDVARRAVSYGLRHSVPVLVDIRDEWPEEFVDLAPSVLRPLARLALAPKFRDAGFICRNATGIIGTGRRHLEYGLRYAGRNARRADAVIPFGYPDGPHVESAEMAAARRWWRELGIDTSTFIVCFFGTIGRFFDLDTVIEAATRLNDEGHFQFVLCGEGSEKKRLSRAARKVRSVLFPGWIDAPRIAALMDMASAGLCPYKVGARMALPNKPIEYLAGSLPIVSSLTGEVAELLEETGCGLTYQADSAVDLVSALRRLHSDVEGRQRMGARGRALFEKEFRLQVVADRLLHQFETARAVANGAEAPLTW